MKVLAFDTSSKSVSIAVFDREICVASFDSIDQPEDASIREQSRILIPQIETLLKSIRWTPQDIDALYVCVGPGSFTGLRMGISVAKAWFLSKPVKIFQFQSGSVTRLKDLKSDMVSEVLDIEALVPIYTNDHFSEAGK
jgi:tRNA threonylcarbamoyl adenosine modification protein YeaZ